MYCTPAPLTSRMMKSAAVLLGMDTYEDRNAMQNGWAGGRARPTCKHETRLLRCRAKQRQSLSRQQVVNLGLQATRACPYVTAQQKPALARVKPVGGRGHKQQAQAASCGYGCKGVGQLQVALSVKMKTHEAHSVGASCLCLCRRRRSCGAAVIAMACGLPVCLPSSVQGRLRR